MRPMPRIVRHVLFPPGLWAIIAIPMAYIAERTWDIADGYSYWGTLYALWLITFVFGSIFHYIVCVLTGLPVEDVTEVPD